MLFLLLLFCIIPFAVAATQQNLTVLIKSRPDLSNLSAYFDLHPSIVESVLRWPNRTFLAPNDEAFAKAAPQQNAFSSSFNIIDVNDTRIGALFEYHTLVPFIRSTDILNGPHIIPTTLVDPAYTSLSGGQVVVGSGIRGQQPIFTSGLQSISTIFVPDLECEGGIVHIVDNFLTIPPSALETLMPLGLTAAEGAFTKETTLGSALGSALPETNLTLFVPANAAFDAVGSIFGNNTDMPEARLSNILAYHVVPDMVNYLVSFHNISLPTLLSSEHLHIVAGEDGKIFVNSAEAVIRNVLAAEGVLHVIDNVLNPNNSTAVPDPTAISQAPAFSGATPLSGGVVPFTTGHLSGATSPSSGGPSMRAKAGMGTGIGIGVVVLVAAIAVLSFFLCLRRQKRLVHISPRAKRFEISPPARRKVIAKTPVKVGEEILHMETFGAKQKLDGRTMGMGSDSDARRGVSRAKDEGLTERENELVFS